MPTSNPSMKSTLSFTLIFVILVAAVIALAGCSSRDEQLLGTWRRDTHIPTVIFELNLLRNGSGTTTEGVNGRVTESPLSWSTRNGQLTLTIHYADYGDVVKTGYYSLSDDGLVLIYYIYESRGTWIRINDD